MIPVVGPCPDAAILVANVLGAAAVHAGTGYLAHRWPDRRLQHDGPLLRTRGWERGGRAYDRLAIRRWKDRLPEAGALFAGGVSKRHVELATLERFVVATRRAELAHWWALACTPLFALWNPPLGLVLMVLYQLAANVPCLLVQRYNRPRAQRALAHRP